MLHTLLCLIRLRFTSITFWFRVLCSWIMPTHMCCCCAVPRSQIVPGPTSKARRGHPNPPCPLLFKFPPRSSVLWDLNTGQFLVPQCYWEGICYIEIQHCFKIWEKCIFPIKRHFLPRKEIRFTALQFLSTSAVVRACVSCQPHISTCLLPWLPQPTSQPPRLKWSLTSTPQVLVALLHSGS